MGLGKGVIAQIRHFYCLVRFFSLNFEGDLDFYVNKLIRVFVCLFGCLHVTVSQTRSYFTKRGKSEVCVVFEGYKFLEYLFHLFCG